MCALSDIEADPDKHFGAAAVYGRIVVDDRADSDLLHSSDSARPD
jgi:hypothetical protein